jgi:hypothetical protein
MGKLVDILGPRRFRNSQTGRYLLSSSPWAAVQVYAKTALALPITEKLMRQTLLLEAAESIEPFQRIIDAYSDIHQHCKVWDEKTYPASVDLAADLAQYSRYAATYYNAMVPYAKKLIDDPTNDEARRELAVIAGRLTRQAQTRAESAKKVQDSVAKFALETEEDQRVIQGGSKVEEGKEGGLAGFYREKYSSTSTEGRALEEQLRAANRLLDEAKSEYRDDVIIAATTPTYATVPVFGWIIAPTIAGIYTKKALDALETMDRARVEIARLESTKRRNALLMAEIDRARISIGTIRKAMNDALPIIQEIRAAWQTMSANLANLVVILETDLKDSVKENPEFIQTDIAIALGEWKKIGEEADAYAKHAYVDVAPAAKAA